MPGTPDPFALVDFAGVLMLDFDGPLAKLMPPPANVVIADRVREAVDVEWPEELANSVDHIAQLRYLADDPVNGPLAHEASGELEIELARTCQPATWLDALVERINERNVPTAVVTNNITESARVFLERMEIGENWVLSGREPDTIGLMKPDPHLLTEALKALGARPEQALFVGDMVTDAEAARRAGVKSLGYAIGPKMVDRLREAGMSEVIPGWDPTLFGGEGKAAGGQIISGADLLGDKTRRR